MNKLCDLVQSIVEQNLMLGERLKALDPIAAPPLIRSSEDNASVANGANIKRDGRGFAFEELLMNSRAYRKAAGDNTDAFSIVSSAGRTASWSVLSGLSLSEISNIGILALPIFAVDISNSNIYDFETPTADPGFPVGDAIEAVSPDSKSSGRRRSISRLFDPLRRRSEPQETPFPPAESLIFGQAIAESVRIANVAISLTNLNGESFIYGYVPIIVAKIAVLLKVRASEFQLKTAEIRVNDLFWQPLLRTYLPQPATLVASWLYKRSSTILLVLVKASIGIAQGTLFTTVLDCCYAT